MTTKQDRPDHYSTHRRAVLRELTEYADGTTDALDTAWVRLCYARIEDVGPLTPKGRRWRASTQA